MARRTPDPDAPLASRINRGLAVVVWVLDAAAVVAAVAGSGAGGLAAVLPGSAVALAVWLGLWRPSLTVTDAGIRVVNVLRTVDIPWPALIHVDTRYALTLFTPGRRTEVFAAPAPGRTASFVVGRNERRRSGSTSEHPRDLHATESGQAAALVRDRWDELREAGLIESGVADETRLGIRWHARSLAALTVLVTASLVVLALQNAG